jgi:ABC-type nickel/cobalt efflux system permease component RcnA
MRIGLVVFLLVAGLWVVWSGLPTFADIVTWASAQQRGFQTDMARSVRAIQRGEAGSWIALVGAAGAYGVVHAAGPGHGKYLIGGMGFGSEVSVRRMLALAIASSLAQAVWAITLVYGGFWLFRMSAARMTTLAEDWLAPASYLAIGAIGAILAIRGAGLLWRRVRPRPRNLWLGVGSDHSCCAHYTVTPAQVAALTTRRDAVALVTSIAVRPCTGAIFLLVIAWQLDIHLAGACAVIAMGLGTALLTSAVAVSSVSMRGLTLLSTGRFGLAGLVLPVVQILAGVAVLSISCGLLVRALA